MHCDTNQTALIGKLWAEGVVRCVGGAGTPLAPAVGVGEVRNVGAAPDPPCSPAGDTEKQLCLLLFACPPPWIVEC